MGATPGVRRGTLLVTYQQCTTLFDKLYSQQMNFRLGAGPRKLICEEYIPPRLTPRKINNSKECCHSFIHHSMFSIRLVFVCYTRQQSLPVCAGLCHFT